VNRRTSQVEVSGDFLDSLVTDVDRRIPKRISRDGKLLEPAQLRDFHGQLIQQVVGDVELVQMNAAANFRGELREFVLLKVEISQVDQERDLRRDGGELVVTQIEMRDGLRGTHHQEAKVGLGEFADGIVRYVEFLELLKASDLLTREVMKSLVAEVDFHFVAHRQMRSRCVCHRSQ